MSEISVSGRAKGGVARSKKMTAEERSASARAAALAKSEAKKLPSATHGSDEHPLIIGDVNLPCYVLENGMRVFSQRGLISGIQISYGSTRSSTGGGGRLTAFLNQPFIKKHIKQSTLDEISNPVKFIPPHNGKAAHGYNATILADICEAVLASRQENELPEVYWQIAKQCEVLIRGFARVGIIALIDEVTGYQKDRERDALAKILEAFVAKELQPYVKTFPHEYYENLFRLRGLAYPPEKIQLRPRYFGLLTNDIVYERLAPGLLDELKKQAEKDTKKTHLHRRLTQEVGHPKLREHLASVVTIMKLSKNYADFVSKMNIIHPRFGSTFQMDLEDIDK